MKLFVNFLQETFGYNRLYEVETLLEAELLAESRIDFLKKNNPEIDSSHDSLAQHRDAHAIIDHFAEHADPSKNKQYTAHAVKLYKSGNVRQEDAPRMKEAYSNFEKYKPKLANKDINSYKTIGAVEDAVEPHLGTHATKASETREIKHEGAEKVYEDEHITAHHLKTEAAAKHYGKGTKWCTAADNNCMFNHYNEHGPLVMIQRKSDGAKFQAHANTASFMNTKDEPISKEDFESIKPSFHKLIDKHPHLFGADKLD